MPAALPTKVSQAILLLDGRAYALRGFRLQGMQELEGEQRHSSNGSVYEMTPKGSSNLVAIQAEIYDLKQVAIVILPSFGEV